MVADQRPILELRHVSKSFGGVQALKDVQFALVPGEVHAILGENGAGKSTLIKIITGKITGKPGDKFTASKLGEYREYRPVQLLT